ncbi:glutamine amidotransferase [Corynebacterium freiburgense]|uniref:glutamine amidotransferase n=1 Tax=Corynebacterium freiburgense TaxID=556548 RepID=UPI000415242F|nr:glutamine amidotransferase [Corynebacterium freiburgense]WJZ02686.1 glutamine amidotransferase [Corynebacterium freiburgense]
MVSFLLVSPRHGIEIAAAEYLDFLKATGLEASELTQVMLDSASASIGSLDGFDGVFVGGSPLNVTTAEYSPEQQHIHTELTKLFDAPVPTFFVCFGAGFLADLDGGTVGHTHPENSGESLVQLTHAAATDPITKNLPREFSVLTGHTENVVTLGPNATLLATGPKCPIQLFRANETTWASQFHADMDAQAMETRMRFYFDYGYFDPDEFDKIVASLREINTQYSTQILRNFVEYCIQNTDRNHQRSISNVCPISAS